MEGGEREEGKDVGRVGGEKGKEGHMNSSSLNPVSLISPFKRMDAYKTPSHTQPCWSISHTKNMLLFIMRWLKM